MGWVVPGPDAPVGGPGGRRRPETKWWRGHREDLIMGAPEVTSPTAKESGSQTSRRNMGMLIVAAVTFWGLALVFAVLPTKDPIPVPERVMVSAEEIDPSPRFVPMGDDAVTVISVFERKCTDCHDSLVGSSTTRRDVNHYHDTVDMNHGLNGRCVNCHDQEDRNKLVLRDGETVGFSQSTTLCSNCHGPAYRQWQRGVHGKTLGFWNADLGESRKLKCVECHNPHSPHYNPMAPLPPPNTLRMGVQDPDGGAHATGDELSPLMRAQHRDAHGDTPGNTPGAPHAEANDRRGAPHAEAHE
jgi:hypothetical protein